MIIENGDKLIMMGDSVTDVDRQRPYGEGRGFAMGYGYPNLVNALITAFKPELKVRLINMGISGDTTRNLVSRWQSDVMDLKPDWVSIMIGINDVWRQYDVPQIVEEHVYIDEYRENLIWMIENTLPKVKGIILMAPYYIEPRKDDAMRATMDEYGKVCKELAEKYDLVFVDTQAALDKALEHIYPGTFTWDRVHPNTAGHMIIARAFLDAIGFEWK